MPSIYQGVNSNNDSGKGSSSSHHPHQDENEPSGGGRKRPRRNKSAPPTSVTVTSGNSGNGDKALIVGLSNACNQHRLYHAENNHADGEKCKEDLRRLKIILPKVERAYRYRPRAKASKYKEPDAIEVMHLCSFYRDVLEGGYCPKATALFQKEGLVPDVHEVLQRTHYLFQQLTCPKIIAHTKQGKAADQEYAKENNAPMPPDDGARACHYPRFTTWIIEKTITHLLNFLLSHNRHHPSTRRYAILIEKDLYQTLVDLAVLSEHIDEEEEHNKDNPKEEIPSLQLCLFSQISEAMTLQPTNGTAATTEYCLDVLLQKDVVLSLQCATLNALGRWQSLRHEATLDVVQIPAEAGESQGSQGVGDNNPLTDLATPETESLQTLLSSLRPILLSQSVSSLAERARSAALELLVQKGILANMDFSLLLEASLLIIHAIGGVLLRRQQWKQYAASNSPHPTTQSHDVLHNLMVLLRQTVLFPPLVRGYTDSEVKSMLWRSTLMPLVELCLTWIRPTDQQNTSKTIFQRLEEMCLRAIHLGLCCETDAIGKENGLLLGNARVNEVVAPLLELTMDAHLSPVALVILKALLGPIPMDWIGLSELVWEQHHQGGTAARSSLASLSVPPPPAPYPEELVQASPEETLGLSPTKPLSNSPRTQGSGTKGKRRPSLLEDNPLTIRSPTPKRPRLEASSPRPSTQESPSRNSKNDGFVEDLVQDFLLRGLQSAQAFSDYVGSLDEGTSPQPGKLMRYAMRVSSCVHLLLNQSPPEKQQRATDGGGCVVLARLFECWQTLASLLYEHTMSQASADGVVWTPEWQSLADSLVCCGLHYFHVKTHDAIVSSVMNAVFLESCGQCCAALASVAEQLDDSCASQTSMERACSGSCRGLLVALAINATHDLSLLASELCLCDMTPPQTACSIGEESALKDGTFQHDCVFLTMTSLPLQTRCCLLASLCQQKNSASHQTTNDSFSPPPTWSSLQHENSPFRMLLERKPLKWSAMTTTAIVMAPLQLCISCLDSETTNAGAQTSQLGMVLTDFLRVIILPAIDSIQEQECNLQHCASNSLSITMRQVQRLHLLLDEKRIGSQLPNASMEHRWSLCCAMEFLMQSFTMELRTSDAIDWNSPSSGAFDGLRREVSFRLSNAIAVDTSTGENKTLTFEDLTPSARLLRWKSVAWECLRLAAAVDLKQYVWIIRVPFSDSDEMVRAYTSRAIGKVLLANEGIPMFALFSDLDDEWRGIPGSDDHSTVASIEDGGIQQREAAYRDRVVATVFNEIDCLVKFYCEDEYPISTPTGTPQEIDPVREEMESRLRRMSAVRVLTSLCNDTNTTLGKAVTQQALVRLVRLLAISRDLKPKFRDMYTHVSPAAAFGELERLARQKNVRDIMVQEGTTLFMGTLACSSLLPPASWIPTQEDDRGIAHISPFIREQRYFKLYNSIRALLLRPSDKKLTNLSGGASEMQTIVDQVLPDILAHMIHNCDYNALRLFAGFVQHFVKGVKKAEERVVRGREKSASNGESIFESQEGTLGYSDFELRVAAVAIPTPQLENELAQLCSKVEIVGRLLPAIFMNSNQTNLNFFADCVLPKEETLYSLIMSSKEQPVIKGLCGKLGGDPETIGPATHALRTASVALYKDKPDPSSGSDNHQDPEKMTSKWVTKHFMYLIVNLVQYKWKTKSDQEKLHSIRCLNAILAYLQPSDALQYFPQILATVNVANEEAADLMCGADSDVVVAAKIRLLALQALSTFTRIVKKDAQESIAQNLTTIVVSLIPALSEHRFDLEHATLRDVVKRTAKAAVSLLEWLTQGQLGKSLAPYFREIPFLPTSTLLDTVRTNLKSNGVDFDNLLVMTQGTQNGLSRESFSSSVDGKATSVVEAKQQAALSKRIDTVCSLLNNENVSIRKVILEHLLNLLRANRSLFHSLVENEGSSSMGRFLTVRYDDKHCKEQNDSSFSVTKMIGTLMARCVLETDAGTKRILGACLGEVGAIGEHRLGVISMSKVLGSSDSLDQSATSWRLAQPPWQSKLESYELQLVKRHLVVALKAAPSSSDQHKIAFAIQQILQFLNRSRCGESGAGNTDSVEGCEGPRPASMGSWLKGELTEAGVIETVEPLFTSEFSEVDTRSIREPPFFKVSDSYYMWLQLWCRFMAQRSHVGHSPWKRLFHSCRTAFRTPVGLSVAEFLLPLVVLDRLCFGDVRDKDSILQEIQDVFKCNQQGYDNNTIMPQPERRQAVNTIFMIIETWLFWTDTEKGDKRRQSSDSYKNEPNGDSGGWIEDDCVENVNEILEKVPLVLQARAAASVGMHARALRILEMSARKTVVEQVFNATTAEIQNNSIKCKRGCSMALGDHVVSGVELELMKEVLTDLNNCETMAALEENNRHEKPGERMLDSIRQNETSKNWEGALRDYERVQQLRGVNDPKLQWGTLRCLLELGQFESVLNQVKGIANTHQSHSAMPETPSRAMLAKPFAVEAAWRLGRWDTLEDIVGEDDISFQTQSGLSPDAAYQTHLGSAILGLHKKSVKMVSVSLDAARQAVMDSLSSVARESYSRAYPYVVRLQCLRELEDAVELICVTGPSNSMTFMELSKANSRDGWCWQKRLELVAPSSSAAVINSRLALARLAKETVLEGNMFLTVGKKARKSGLFNIAADSLTQAEAVFNSIPRNVGQNGAKEVGGLLDLTKMQLAKLKHDSGQSSAALKMLGQDQVHHLFGLNGGTARRNVLLQKTRLLAANEGSLDDDAAIARFSSRLLQSTHWIVAGGLKDGGEIISRFRLVQEVAPEMEKGHFHFAKYIDSVIQSRVSALMRHGSQQHASVEEDKGRLDAIYCDPSLQNYILIAMKSYAESLKKSTKHIYQALPRLLSLWFELTGINPPAEDKTSSTSLKRQSTFGSSRRPSRGTTTNPADQLKKIKNEACEIVAMSIKKIPPRAFYTAMPQLIAQIMHPNSDTSRCVQNILARVLARFPEQAMWHLAWLYHSKSSPRRKAGETIFSESAKHLISKGKESHGKLLVASKSLIDHLHLVATCEVKKLSKKGTIGLTPWRGDIPLCEFVPPVQAALTACLPSSKDVGSSKDLFPRQIPRMRDFSPTVKVMNSKARPKRITAFVIPAASVSMVRLRKQKANKAPQKGDVGEVHFLVKQEAKGDLRKDARVQDLNTVINRLMASSCNSGKGGYSSQSRQLRLRTFAVTCLSEFTGILEWVPSTTAMRMLIQSAYNPQADNKYTRRGRGSRLVDFGNASLRVDYETKCQEEFFKNGNLALAASNFERLFLKEYPPVFYWWFVSAFQDPHAWYEARTNFTLSAAAWSGVGHVIGLGDRHSENILIDTTTGECVHVDFDCIFDKGLNLPKPEIVPFRLTANMLDAFGPTGADGVYASSLKLAMGTLRDNRDTLLSVLEPFIKDPIIDWKRTRSTQSPNKASKARGVDMTQVQDRQTREAKHSINVIDQRLRGIYNLRNPNIKKYLRKDAFAVDQNDELTQSLPLSVEGQVHKMIAEATSSENLTQLYVGWMPWA